MNYSKAKPSNYLPWCSRLPTTNERLEDRHAHNHTKRRSFGDDLFVCPSLKSSASTGLHLLHDSNAHTPSRMPSWWLIQYQLVRHERKNVLVPKTCAGLNLTGAKPSSPFVS